MRLNNMKYSVLMSVYNKEKPEYLKLSIESMLNQSIKPSEIVVVKDGPLTKELDNIIEEYDNQYKGLFNIVRSEVNIGLGKALNLGLQNCKNELVARMDTDDISLINRCEKQLELFKNDEELVIVGTAIDEFYDNPDKIISSRVVPTEHKEIYEFMKRRSAFNHPTVMYKKSKVLEYGGYADLKRNQDVDLFGRMIFDGCKARNIEESLLLFRSNQSLAKRRKSWENTKSYINVIKSFWKMGYSSIVDYLIVALGQSIMFVCPTNIQHFIYKIFLRK